MKDLAPQPPLDPVTRHAPAQSVPVYRADAFVVTNGANLGDEIAPMDELMLDDVYGLDPVAPLRRLGLEVLADGAFLVSGDTECGRPGHAVHLDCALSLMSPDGMTTDAIVLVEVDASGHIADVYLLPLAPLAARTDYTLVGIDSERARQKFAQVACVSFTRGTHITLASGAQVPIEELKVGDRVLTRDDGVQQVRWIGQSTVRAVGDFAPIVIRAGTLNNDNDLVVSPDHRLFVYQRRDEIGAGQPELLVKARHLVNGDTVFVQEGGFVDYFQLLFDRHHIIYAEGIAAETMLLDPRTRPALPEELLEEVRLLLDQHGRGDGHGIDVSKRLLDRPDAIALLKRASTNR
ncbi:Hint domain-containing protein [Ruegeria marina]|uniref:Hint domain-containing protein n=1 Tax=Ruegeria marina TaxID=639004 RepID=A0A1G6Z507_9RHOB|nr:Hint domain-containing protein [Ruegeria marina]SDD97708.1 Hint domain-containing protein [Ruegeria marina]